MPKTICVAGVSFTCVLGSAEGSVETTSNNRPSSGVELRSFGKEMENRGAASADKAAIIAMAATRATTERSPMCIV